MVSPRTPSFTPLSPRCPTSTKPKTVRGGNTTNAAFNVACDCHYMWLLGGMHTVVFIEITMIHPRAKIVWKMMSSMLALSFAFAKAGCLFCTKRSADWRSVEGWSILHSSNRFEKLLKLSIKLFRNRCKHHRQKSSIRKCARTLATLRNAIVKRPCSLSAHLLHNALPCCSSLKHSAEDISARTAAQLGLFLPWHSLVSTQSLLCTLCQPLICEIPGLPSSGSRDNVGLQDCAQISYSRLKKTTTPELQMPRICWLEM